MTQEELCEYNASIKIPEYARKLRRQKRELFAKGLLNVADIEAHEKSLNRFIND